jgi:hypothetical protein
MRLELKINNEEIKYYRDELSILILGWGEFDTWKLLVAVLLAKKDVGFN